MWIKISSRRYDEKGSENGEKVKEREGEEGREGEGEDGERERDVEPSVETGWYLRLAGGGGCTDRWNCVCILIRGLC